MSKIDKLSILGIRSFDNQFAENIKFHTPLTLIVGLNGSGKTTIIECLKYATTGDLPPNSKGGAFIHDPSLCGEKEVLAQVKMSLQAVSGARLVVSRRLQLLVKKNARQMKTLEGQLVVITANGQRQSISSRVAELDALVPENLGVSRAILDSVIFCHQDESLWPMSEPSSLKKKFDEIFEAQKYTNAIDNIKKIRKAQGEKLQRCKDAETSAKVTKTRADKAEKKSRELEEEVASLAREIAIVDSKIKEANQKSTNAWEHFHKYQGAVDNLKLSQEKEAFHQENINKVKKNLKVRTESEEALHFELENYERRAQERLEQQQQLRTQYDEHGNAIEDCRKKLSSEHSSIGRLEQQKVNYENQKAHRQSIVKEVSRQTNIRGFDFELDDSRIAEFMQRLSKLCTEQHAVLEKARKAAERDLEDIRHKRTGMSDQKSTLSANQKTIEEQISSNEQKIKHLRVELSQLRADDSEEAIMDGKIEKLDSELSKLKEQYREASWEPKIQQLDIDLRETTERNARLNEDLVRGTKNAGDVARLRLIEDNISTGQTNLERLRGVNETKLKSFLNHSWNPATISEDHRRVSQQYASELQKVEGDRSLAARNLDQIEFESSRTRKDLDTSIAERGEYRNSLREIMEGEPEDYPSELADLQKGRDELQTDVNNFRNEMEFYKKGISMAESKQNKCKLCARSFQSEQEKQNFVKLLRNKLDQTQDMKKSQADLAEQEGILQKMKDSRSKYEVWTRLTTIEIPRLESSLTELTSKKVPLLKEVEAIDTRLSRLEGNKADIDSLAKPVTSIAKFNEEITSLRQQAKDLTAANETETLLLSLDDVRDQLRSIADHSQSLVRSKDRLATQKEDAQAAVNKMELRLRDARSEMLETKHQLKDKNVKAKQIDELVTLTQALKEKSQQLEGQIKEIIPQLEVVQLQIDDAVSQWTEREASLRNEELRLTEGQRKLDQVTKDIATYLDQGALVKHQRALGEIKSYEGRIEKLEGERTEVIKSINKITEDLRNQDATKRIIEENLDYRKSQRELETLKEEISKLSAQVDQADQGRWQQDALQWDRKHNQSSMEKTSKLGQAKAKDDQLASLLQEWETDYKDAAFQYKKAHIEVETTKAAVEDLGRYATALDKAIMKFHSIKMEEINQIIEDLWKRTYQGTDVDKILIRSDNETGNKSRSYNYRVCMVKQDTEMDMRGRCSAGQKVLASIIIRLALAESFGSNCGLIALDEPTTNLDRDNIRSLAHSLHDIIEVRRRQANFQLIVITHDEEFLRFMRCPDFCDDYYRISRNERQKSIIELQSIAEVM